MKYRYKRGLKGVRKFINRVVALFFSLCMAMQLGAGDVFFVFAQSLDDSVIESDT